MKKTINDLINENSNFNKSYDDIKNQIDVSQYVTKGKKFNFKLLTSLCTIILLVLTFTIICLSNIEVLAQSIHNIVEDYKSGELFPLIDKIPANLNEVADSLETYDEFYVSNINDNDISLYLYNTEIALLKENLDLIYNLKVEDVLKRREFNRIELNSCIRLIVNDNDNSDRQLIFLFKQNNNIYNEMYVFNEETNRGYKVISDDVSIFTNQLLMINEYSLEERLKTIFNNNFNNQIIKEEKEIDFEVIDIIGVNKDIYILRPNYLTNNIYYNETVEGYNFTDVNNPNPIYIWKDEIFYTLQESLDNKIIITYELSKLHSTFYYYINESKILNLLKENNIQKINTNYGVFGQKNALVFSILDNDVDSFEYVNNIEFDNHFKTKLYAYYNNELYSIKEAFDKQILNNNDLENIAKRYNPNKISILAKFEWLNNIEVGDIISIQTIQKFPTAVPGKRTQIKTTTSFEEISRILTELKQVNLYLKIYNSSPVVGGNNAIILIINTKDEKYEISTATLDYDKFPSILNDYDITYGNE